MKRILILALLVLVVGCEEKLSEYDQNAAILKAECEQLTQETGRLHEAVIGRYLGSQAITQTVEPSGKKASASHKMVFDTEEGDRSIVYSFEPSNENWANFREAIKSTFGDAALKNTEDTVDVYGICAWKNGPDIWFGDIEQIKKISPDN